MGVHGLLTTEEDQSMIDNYRVDDVHDDGSERERALQRERSTKKFLLQQLRVQLLVKYRRETSQLGCNVWTKCT